TTSRLPALVSVGCVACAAAGSDASARHESTRHVIKTFRTRDFLVMYFPSLNRQSCIHGWVDATAIYLKREISRGCYLSSRYEATNFVTDIAQQHELVMPLNRSIGNVVQR